MIRIRQIKVPVEEANLVKYIAKKLHIKEDNILSFKVHKRSIDARYKPNIFCIYEVDAEIQNENKFLNRSSDIIKTPNEKYEYSCTGTKRLENRIVVVGTGPAGLFCAYMLALNGYAPLVIERGDTVEIRTQKIETFWSAGVLDTECNIQFGEGGAGTFSDGKLGTLVSDKQNRMRKVFEIFYENGAPSEILYENKPHIGTDKLRDVIVKMRKNIIKMGGEVRFNTKLTDIKHEDGKLKSIIVNGKEKIPTDVLVLAIGHSARDTFLRLYDNGIMMQNKPFAVGFRIMHDQNFINESQYGVNYPKILGEASYKLVYNAKNGRSIYSFCMCPGGYIVNASSENGMLAINGMSNHARESGTANAAILCSVDKSIYGDGVFDGMNFQKKLEKTAYELGKGKIPVSTVSDYFENKESQKIPPNLKVLGNYTEVNLNKIFPKIINDSLKEGLINFNKKIPGFSSTPAYLAGVESRSSSPIKIPRDENFESNIKGIYPCGEGAGYAGGITSAAMDGIKIFEKITSLYKKCM